MHASLKELNSRWHLWHQCYNLILAQYIYDTFKSLSDFNTLTRSVLNHLKQFICVNQCKHTWLLQRECYESIIRHLVFTTSFFESSKGQVESWPSFGLVLALCRTRQHFPFDKSCCFSPKWRKSLQHFLLIGCQTTWHLMKESKKHLTFAPILQMWGGSYGGQSNRHFTVLHFVFCMALQLSQSNGDHMPWLFIQHDPSLLQPRTLARLETTCYSQTQGRILNVQQVSHHMCNMHQLLKRFYHSVLRHSKWFKKCLNMSSILWKKPLKRKQKRMDK